MAEPAVKKEQTQELPKKKRDRKFAIIRFPGKSRKTDPDIVHVGVNGEKWFGKRNEYLPAPAHILEAIKNAKEPVVEDDDPGSPRVMSRRRKIVGFAPRFPFELMGWLTKDNYDKARKIALERSLTEEEVYELLGE